MKIGILCAGDEELAPFLPLISNCKITEKAMLKFHAGQIDILLPVPVGDEGVPIVKAVIVRAGVLRTFPAKGHPAVGQGAFGDGAALVARPAAAAGTVSAQMHGAKGAVETAEGEASLLSDKAFHTVFPLKTTAAALPGTPGFSPGRRGRSGFRCTRIPAKSRSGPLRSSG